MHKELDEWEPEELWEDMTDIEPERCEADMPNNGVCLHRLKRDGSCPNARNHLSRA